MGIEGPVIPELYKLKNLLYTTCRIVTYDKDGFEDGVGTGFFYHVLDMDEHGQDYRIELLVTNKHVIEDAAKGSLVFHLGPIVDGFPTGGTYKLTIDDFEAKFILYSDPNIDLCALDISSYLTEIRKRTGKDIHYQAFSSIQIQDDDDLKKMFPVTDVYMVGYSEGIWDEINNLPITRRGVTASHPYFDFNAKSQGAIDIAAFQGSSGSRIISFEAGPPTYDAPPPVMFKLLGVLWGGEYSTVDGELITISIPTRKKQVPRTHIMIHLGYYVKAKELLEFDNHFTSESV